MSTCVTEYFGIESENGKTCCSSFCDECAGIGCGSGGNPSDCCAVEIASMGQDCSVTGEAPCFISPPEADFVVKHSIVYFIVLVVVPFILLVIMCNCISFYRRKKVESDEHLYGHNTCPVQLNTEAV